jgi:hypothetical protein
MRRKLAILTKQKMRAVEPRCPRRAATMSICWTCEATAARLDEDEIAPLFRLLEGAEKRHRVRLAPDYQSHFHGSNGGRSSPGAVMDCADAHAFNDGSEGSGLAQLTGPLLKER